MSQAKTTTSFEVILSQKVILVGMSALTASLAPGKLRVKPKELKRSQSVLDQALRVAATDGKPMNLAAALRAGANPAVCDSSGVTALMHASRSGSLSCVKKLLATENAGLELIDTNGCNAWFHALESGNSKTMEEVGRAFEERDKKKKKKAAKNWNCVVGTYAKYYRAIHLAVNSGSVRCVELAIKAGVKTDGFNGSQSRSALMVAAQKGSVEMVSLLAEAGDAKLVSPRRETALSCAVQGARHEVAKLLAPKSGRAICDGALLLAARDGAADMVELLIPWSNRSIRDNEGATPSMLAAQCKDIDTFIKLLPMPDPWARDMMGRSVLLYAIRSMSLVMVGKVLDEMSRTTPSNLVLCVELAKALGAAVEQHGAINPLLPYLTLRLDVHIQAEEVAAQTVINLGPKHNVPRL